MAFWNKPLTQKHHVAEVITYGGPHDTLVWKHPNENFNTNTQLVVGPLQEAIFVKGEHVLERFVPGIYTLSTENYPFVRALVGLEVDADAVLPFSCSVYYINKVISMEIDWGTDTPISVVDPIYRVPIDIRGYGDFSLRVENGRKFMEKLVGQTYGLSHQEIQQLFTNMMATQVRGVISGAMHERQLSPIGIDAHLPEMSAVVTEKVRPIFEPYGMSVVHFTIAAISVPELDTIKQTARDLHEDRMGTDVTAENRRNMAQAQAFENRELNITEQQKRVAQIDQTLASNPGPVIGGACGMVSPDVIGGNIVQPCTAGIADIARMMMNRSEQPAQQQQAESGSSMPGGMLMGMMEESELQPITQPAQESFEARARKVKFLLDNGMITQEKYMEKLEVLIDAITEPELIAPRVDRIAQDDHFSNQYVEQSNVAFSAVVPKRLMHGEYSIINLVIYENESRNIVDEMLKDEDALAKEHHGSTMMLCKGDRVLINLRASQIELDMTEPVQMWHGKHLVFSFPVLVPEDYPQRSVLFTAYVYINEVIATRLTFKVKCEETEPTVIEVQRQDVRSAFVSYSSRDRASVASRLQGICSARRDLDVFFDVSSIHSGERWENVLKQEILKRDVMFLFWSENAKSSEWVDREWRYALEKKGMDAICPIPLVRPEQCPPPEELKQLHFNDVLLYIINASTIKPGQL